MPNATSADPVFRYRDFWAFYALSFLFLALLPLLALVFNDGHLDFSAAAAAATDKTGVEWTSNIVAVLRLASVEPVLLLSLLGSLAPALAAVTVLLFLRNRMLWSAFLSRFRLYGRGTFGGALAIYLGIFALLVPCLFLIFELRVMLGLEYSRVVTLSPYLVGAILMAAFLDQGALLEEVGWRGLAGPELQRRMGNPLLAALLVGVCWGLWHLPRDITTGVIDRLGTTTYALQFLPAFLMGTISISIIASYFMNKLGGSILAAIIVHGLTNDAIGISGSATIAEALTPVHQATKNLPFALIAAGLAIMSRGALGAEEVASPNREPA